VHLNAAVRAVLAALGSAALALAALGAEPADRIVLNLEPTRENPRNSEGSFVTLKSGRIAFYYSQFFGGYIGDYTPARIAEIHSEDGGATWSSPRAVVERGENQNVMSVSVLRLASGKLALLYMAKRNWLDCRPYLRVSADDGASWSEPVLVVEAPGYFVVNNDRVIQTRAGRLIVPVAFHRLRSTANDPARSWDPRAIALWYYSDDDGGTWKEASSWWTLPVATKSGLQEPGVVELAGGGLLCWTRTDQGSQYALRSQDGGDSWSAPEPSELKSPLSPAAIKRLPDSADLLAVFNDHSGRFAFPQQHRLYGGRAPLVAAISHDGGRTWPVRRLIEGGLRGQYSYPAIHFVDGAVLLAYLDADGDGNDLGPPSSRLRIRRISLRSERSRSSSARAFRRRAASAGGDGPEACRRHSPGPRHSIERARLTTARRA